MSKCCKKHYEPCCEPCCDYGYGEKGGFGNIYSLLILILIVCQFCGCKGKLWGKHDDDEECGVDNSILFIIAIFVLVYCSCGKGLFGGGCQY